MRHRFDPPGKKIGLSALGPSGTTVAHIVVASELPRERSTLLVRLRAAGPLRPQVSEELSALPDDAHERAVALEILLSLRHVLGSKLHRTAEEEGFIVSMQGMADKLIERGRIEGRDEGATRGA